MLTSLELSGLALSELDLSELTLSELALSELALSELALSELALSELALSELALSELALSELALSVIPVLPRWILRMLILVLSRLVWFLISIGSVEWLLCVFQTSISTAPVVRNAFIEPLLLIRWERRVHALWTAVALLTTGEACWNSILRLIVVGAL